MIDYQKIAAHCKTHSTISEKVIDNFLMHYAFTKERLETKMKADFSKYRHLDFGEVHSSFINFCKAEYIVSKIFLKNGLIKKYLNHSAIKQLTKEEYAFLELQSQHPWKFSFAIVLDNPADCFYEMEDVFSGESYLLYSPSMKSTLKNSNPLLWFNLIGYNGLCWQTFGLVNSFRSFDVDDIFFFATELKPSISNEDELVEEVETNPVPFFMLSIGADKPQIFHKEYAICHHQATDSLPAFSLESFKDKFIVAWNEDVFQLKLKNNFSPFA